MHTIYEVIKADNNINCRKTIDELLDVLKKYLDLVEQDIDCYDTFVQFARKDVFHNNNHLSLFKNEDDIEIKKIEVLKNTKSNIYFDNDTTLKQIFIYYEPLTCRVFCNSAMLICEIYLLLGIDLEDINNKTQIYYHYKFRKGQYLMDFGEFADKYILNINN